MEIENDEYFVTEEGGTDGCKPSDLSDLLSCPSAIVKKLREQWKTEHRGGCRILNIGDKCECHLCLIDRLQELAENRAK